MSGEETTTTISSEPTSNHDPSATALPPTTLPESGGIGASSSAATQDDGTEEVGTLEWAQVIELQAFSERKVWIEEKTRVNTMLHSSNDFLMAKTESRRFVFSYWNKCHQ